MCGFTGELSFINASFEQIKKANNFSIPRGPDKTSNYYGSDFLNFNFWFNRLAIIDLSEKADQPMISKDKNFILMFNGEIYNSPQLRKILKKQNYKFNTSHSDTETLFAGLQLFGIDFIEQLEGQFAFFFWNKLTKTVYLVRDRLGQKPLYYLNSEKNFLFASNLKSIISNTQNLRLNKDSISSYLLFGSIFSPQTLFEGINKLNPGHYLEIKYENESFIQKKIKYWDVQNKLDNKKFQIDEFSNLFENAVLKRTLSDVPIASFLSGGIDSTSIVKKQFDNQLEINTFSVIVNNEKLNEKKYIDQVVKKYSTNHYEVKIDSQISREKIIECLTSLDEPYADPSVVPSYILSEEISKHFKVALSGDGGDELLGGYERIKKHKNNLFQNKHIYGLLYKFYPTLFGSGTKLKAKRSIADSYLAYLGDEKFLYSLLNQKSNIEDFVNFMDLGSIYKSILNCEYNYYLSEQMMYKVDRTSMANSLEVRSPLVDHLLVEYVFQHSEEYFYTEKNKFFLYDYLSQDFEQTFLERPKQGFVFDYQDWVYSNLDFIFDKIKSSEINDLIEIEKLYKFKYVQTRINALRIWRIFVLSNYLSEIRNL